MYLSIVIPCYNEEKRIGRTLDRMAEYFSDKDYEYEILIVNNGSTDKTSQVAMSFGDRLPLRIISRNNYGKGWAVKEGLLASRGLYRLITDADNSTDIGQLEKFLDEAERGTDIVISSRRMDSSIITHPQPLHRRFLGNIFAGIVRLIVPLGIRDTQNGFKLFSKRAVENIFPHQTIFYWAWDVEILALARKFQYRIKELPIVWVNDDDSTMSFKGMVRMLFEVVLTRLHLMTRDYNKGVSARFPEVSFTNGR